jgi:hypothetical protein
MAMTLVETTISKTTIHMMIADADDPETVKEWVEFEVPLKPLTFAEQGGARALGNPSEQLLAVSQVAALHYVRDAIAAEIRRLSNQ